MNPTIISALISAGAAILVSVLTNHASNEKTRALLEYRLSELEKKVDKHNNLVERMYKVEELTSVQEEKLKVANHRLDDLEKGA